MIDLKSTLPDPLHNETQTGVDAAMASLSNSITATPREVTANKPASRTHTRRVMTAALAVAACVLVALIGVSRVLSGGGTGPTWAAADIAVAEQTPLLLLQAPGWSVKGFGQSETANKSGGITFSNGDRKTDVSLHWDPKSRFNFRRKQLASHAEQLPAIMIDGHRAQLFRQHNEGGPPWFTGHSAIWVSGKHVLILSNSYRGLPNKLEKDRFTNLAAQLKAVSADELLASLPKNYLLPSQLSGAASEILADVPLPPGYTTETVLKNLRSSTHETLAVRLITRAECGWIRNWVAARKLGDKSEMKRISNTLAPYKSWKYSRFTLDPTGAKSWVGAGWIEALKKGGRMDFGRGDVRDIGPIYYDWMGCAML